MFLFVSSSYFVSQFIATDMRFPSIFCFIPNPQVWHYPHPFYIPPSSFSDISCFPSAQPVFELSCPSALGWRGESRSLCNSLNHCCITWGVEKVLGIREVGKQECFFCVLPVCCFMLYSSELPEQRGQDMAWVLPESLFWSQLLLMIQPYVQDFNSLPRLESPFQGNPGSRVFQLAVAVPCCCSLVFLLSPCRVEIELPVGPLRVHVRSSSSVGGAAQAARRPPAKPGTIVSQSGMTPCAATCQMFPPLCLSFVPVNELFGLRLYFLCVHLCVRISHRQWNSTGHSQQNFLCSWFLVSFSVFIL